MDYLTSVVSFPRLGITLSISPVAVHIGSKPIYWYAIIILCGFIAGLLLVTSGSEKRGLKKDHVWDIALSGIIFGILCARIYYVIFSWSEYKSNLSDIFKIWEGGLAIYGGVIGGVISTCIYSRVKRINLLNALDVCCIGLLLGQAIGRWGNFFNCEVYGGVTASLFGMSINGADPVRPLFLYESLWSLIGVIVIALLRDKKTKNGQVMCLYLFWYSIGRLFLEGLRDPEYILYLIPGKLGISQAVAVLFIILSVAGFIFVTRSDKEYFKPVPPITEAAK